MTTTGLPDTTLNCVRKKTTTFSKVARSIINIIVNVHHLKFENYAYDLGISPNTLTENETLCIDI